MAAPLVSKPAAMPCKCPCLKTQAIEFIVILSKMMRVFKEVRGRAFDGPQGREGGTLTAAPFYFTVRKLVCIKKCSISL
jgi:hypothetical protein